MIVMIIVYKKLEINLWTLIFKENEIVRFFVKPFVVFNSTKL
jgi:hypothetical protein